MISSNMLFWKKDNTVSKQEEPKKKGEVENILSTSEFLYILKQSPSDRDLLMEKLKLRFSIMLNDFMFIRLYFLIEE